MVKETGKKIFCEDLLPKEKLYDLQNKKHGLNCQRANTSETEIIITTLNFFFENEN